MAVAIVGERLSGGFRTRPASRGSLLTIEGSACPISSPMLFVLPQVCNPGLAAFTGQKEVPAESQQVLKQLIALIGAPATTWMDISGSAAGYGGCTKRFHRAAQPGASIAPRKPLVSPLLL
jgi:hypothetical protein